MNMRTVAVTGMGLVNSLGDGVAPVWEAMSAGKTGIAEGGDPTHPAGFRWAGRVASPSLPGNLPPRLHSQTKFLNPGSILGVAAAWEAAAQAALPDDIPAERRALYVATGDMTRADGLFAYPALREASEGTFREAPPERLNRAMLDRVYPFFLLESIFNNPFSFLAAALGCMGPGTTLAIQSPCGLQSIGLAWRAVRSGRADAAFAVGCGSWVSPLPQAELTKAGQLSAAQEGASSYRPFDRRRDGFLLGDGGAALMLEPLDAALQRGATILGVLRGLGEATGSPLEQEVPARTILTAMRLALSEAGAHPRELGFICPFGAGTVEGDGNEAEALTELLDSTPTPVCALKPYTGHMSAASDVAEVVLGLLAARSARVPATPGFIAGNDSCGRLSLSAQEQACASPLFLTCSQGPGGRATALAVEARN